MKRRVLAALLCAGLLGPASAFAALDGEVELIDRPSGFGALPFDGINEASVDRHAFSLDGCRVAIESDNDVLSALDDDAGTDVFVIDRCTAGHPAILASATAAGVPADGDSFSPSLSADGRKVAFTTTARNLLPAGTTVNHAVVVKNLDTGEVTVASRGSGASGAVADSFEGVISGDGNAVAFQGRGVIEASNATGVADEEDVYVRYLAAGETRMASVIPPSTRGGADGDFDVSYDGLEVALITQSALDPSDSDGEDSAYLMRNLLGTPTADQVSGTVAPREVAISGDGTRVAFADDRLWMATCAPSCGAPAAVDSATPPTGSVSIDGIGFPAGSSAPSHLFWSTDRSLVAADTDSEYDFYVRDLGAATNFRAAPHAAGGVAGGDFDPGDASAFMAVDTALPGTDGVRPQVFTYDDGGNTTLLSLPDGETRRGETYNTSVDRLHAVSESGRFVVMKTTSPGLGAPSPAPGRFWLAQAIVRDVAGGITTLASSAIGGGPADRHVDNQSIDAAGDRVAFESEATNLVPGPAGDTIHVYVRDLATGATQLVDRRPDGSPVAGGAHDAVLSGDGTKVVFISDSPDLPDANTFDHAYLADLATGSVTLVDRTADGAVADNDASEVDSSADGSRVAFISSAQNLGAFASAQQRVFVKDVASGALTFASAPESGTPPLRAHGLSLSGDASRVAWAEDDPGFGYGSDGIAHIFVRDLAAGTTTLASTGGPTAPGAQEFEAALDGTGTRLAFERRFDDAPGRPLLRDLATGTTTELLPGRRSPGFGLSISPDGHCVAVNSNSGDVLPTGNPSPDFDHVYMLGVGADCPPVPPGAGGPGAGTADTTPTAITRLRMLRKRFAVAKRRTALSARRRRAKRGSAFLFTLSENARTSVAVARALPGRRSGKRCVKPRRKLKRRCTRYRTLATLTRKKTKAGANQIAFSGRLGSRRLKPGRYRATVGAVDAAGNRAARRRVSFRVVRR